MMTLCITSRRCVVAVHRRYHKFVLLGRTRVAPEALSTGKCRASKCRQVLASSFIMKYPGVKRPI